MAVKEHPVTDADVEAVCKLLRAGTPRKTIFADARYPSRSHFTKALATRDDWQALVNDADREYLITLAEELVAIADDTSKDTLTRADGSVYPNTEWISRSKLRVETRLKLLSKLWPEKFGDKVEVKGTVTLGQLLAAVPVVRDPLDDKQDSDDQRTH